MNVDLSEEMIATIMLALKSRAMSNATGTVQRAAKAQQEADLEAFEALVGMDHRTVLARARKAEKRARQNEERAKIGMPPLLTNAEASLNPAEGRFKDGLWMAGPRGHRIYIK